MNTTFLVLISVIALIAIVSSLAATLGGRPPRAATDPERLAQLRDRVADAEARRLHAQVDERIAEEVHARDSAPQRSPGTTLERAWAGGV